MLNLWVIHCQMKGLFMLILVVPAVWESDFCGLSNLSSNHRKIARSIFMCSILVGMVESPPPFPHPQLSWANSMSKMA